MAKYKLNERLIINWLDVVHNSSWMSYEEAIKVPPEVYCKTIGHFLSQDETFIWLSSSIGRKRKGEVDQIIIPKGMIQKIRRLAIKKEKK